jgi:surface antigen
MRMSARAIAVALAGTLAVSACETEEEFWGTMGALGGGLAAGMLVGDDNGAVLAAAVIAGAAAGGWLGANFGRGLDEAERERAAASTQRVLNQEIPSNSPLRSASATYSPQAAAVAPTADWTSPTNPQTVSGRTTLLQVAADGGGGECRTVRQLVVVNGREEAQDAQFCRANASSQWQMA